jgi:hypothetical protein
MTPMVAFGVGVVIGVIVGPFIYFAVMDLLGRVLVSDGRQRRS